MLWDDTAGDGALASRSLSTRALGEALAQVRDITGKGIDLLYLDACSMAMAEVAYEVRESVGYLLATQNTKWATFPYDRLLPEVATAPDMQTLGARWLAIETAFLEPVPDADYTFSLLDLAGMDGVAAATDSLVAALRPQLPAQLSQLDEALTASAFFESNYDGVIDTSDTYIDLFALSGQLAQRFGDSPEVAAAAIAMQDAISATVVSEAHRRTVNSAPPASWTDIGGLSIYWPLAADEEKRLALYNATNLQWAAASQWDEWLTNYWQSVEERNLTALEACAQTAACPGLTGWGFVDEPQTRIFVPLVQR
jgi:hypothetical protein